MSNEPNNSSNYSFWADQVTKTAEVPPQENSYTNDSNDSYHSYTAPQPEPPKKNKKGKKAAALVGKAAVFGLIAGATFYGSLSTLRAIAGDERKSNAPIYIGGANHDLNVDRVNNDTTIPSTEIVSSTSLKGADVSSVVEDVMPSIVTITSTFNSSYNVWGFEYGGERSGGGSGIIIGKKDNTLYIATNNHVVDGATDIKVKLIDGTETTAEIRGRNSAADLAVITINTSKLSKKALSSIKVAKLGNSNKVKVGEMSIAIGNALGYGQSVTVGYISAKDREIKVDTGATLTVLQTDAAINPGNSGGALINTKGEVIGINSAKLTNTNVEGIGYAIPISIAQPIVDDLMNREILTDAERGYLGLYPQNVDESTAKMYDWPIGVYVAKLVEGGAADKAGIYQGDIITSINNITISSSDQLRETVNSYRYGTKVTVTLMRFHNGEYKELTKEVVLQKNTDDNQNSSNSSEQAPENKESLPEENKKDNNRIEIPDQEDPFSFFFHN